MEKTIAVSFEETNIKIVRASSRGSGFSVDRAETIEYDELDEFLQKEKSSEFIVTYDFKEAYHGFLSIPIVTPRYQKKIISSELLKLTKLENLSFTYVPIGERVVDTKKVLEIFYFGVNHEVIQDVVGRFYDFNKVVKAVYPTVFSAASLIHSSTPEEAHMGIFSTGEEKIIFLTRRGSVYFIRNYESMDAELSDFDIQNINMTISYCIQNMRINPSSVILLGNLSRSCNIKTMTTVPLASLHKGMKIHLDSDMFNEYFLPIASLSAPKLSNILSSDFRNINMLSSYMRYATKAFVILAVICLGVLLYDARDIVDKRERLQAAMTNRYAVESIHTEYRKRKEALENMSPVISFLNTASPDLQALLEGLAEMNIRDFRFNVIKARSKGGNSYSVIINGISLFDAYAPMQSTFDDMTARLDNMKDITVQDKSINVSNKSFEIELLYRKTG